MQAHSILTRACAQVGLQAEGAELIRAGENTLYRLPDGIVARITRRGQAAVAAKEIRVSRWLQQAGIPVVSFLSGISQPIEIDGRAVTYWHELPEHEEGDIQQVADTLRQIHNLQPSPEVALPALAPFVRLEQRISEAGVFVAEDRRWLRRHLFTLIEQYKELPGGLPYAAVHGDAWGGNIVTTRTKASVVLDLERFAFGPPEWDLVSIAVERFTFGTLAASEWRRFCERYGYDVTHWAGYSILRDARELRKVTFAAQMAAQHPNLNEQARYRLACIRGERGPRPWHWTAVP